MHKKIIIALPVILILILFYTCDIISPPVSENKILGKWNWIESTGGFAGGKITPETAGYHIKIEFTGIHKYYKYKDQDLERETSYAIVQKDINGDEQVEEVLLLDEDPIEQNIQFVGDDTLLLTENCMDCYRHTYVKWGK